MTENTRGILIAIEGMDGSGKSTLRDSLTGLLKRLGLDVVTTREIGGTPFAEKMRDAIFSSGKETIDPTARALATAAARVQHCEMVIKPALAAGKIVITDRYYPSTLVYQCQKDGVKLAAEINDSLISDGTIPTPDFLLFLNGPLDTIYDRAVARKNLDNETYKVGKETYSETRRQYKQVIAAERWRLQDQAVLELNAANEPQEVALEALSHILKNAPSLGHSNGV